MRIGIDSRLLYVPVVKGIGIYLRNLLANLALIDEDNEYSIA